MKKIVNMEMLENLREIMGPDFSKLVFTYLKDAEFRLAELNAFMNRNDMDNVRRILHGLKGSSLNIGAEIFADLCANAETAIIEGRLTDLQRLVEPLKPQFQMVKSTLFSLV